MPGPDARSAVHTADLDAPPENAYRLVADVLHWPLLFSPCIWSQVLDAAPAEAARAAEPAAPSAAGEEPAAPSAAGEEPAAPSAAGTPPRPFGGLGATDERIRLWAVVGSGVRSWTSRRTLDPAALRVDFAQQEPAAPIVRMSGHWSFGAEPGSPAATHRLALHHAWATEGGQEVGDRIEAALDHNSKEEIAAVKAWAERPQAPEELIFSFSDTLLVDGPVSEVYDFLYRADLWPARLPHVAALDVETAPESPAGTEVQVQTMDMKTKGADGSVHATQSVRLCFADRRIVYKQTTVPRGLLGHTGEWLFEETPAGTLVTARHQVALDPGALEGVFGPGTTLESARRLVRDALGGNSRRTLGEARRHVESLGQAVR
ncbi:aromatase/cyclase [Streptomyces sp. NPDC057674]|uniref:aromatase/cyclase n=1 Tax=Streptomyces sp. NPDC057674 TaxID=3346203 RepID=UPI00369321EF